MSRATRPEVVTTTGYFFAWGALTRSLVRAALYASSLDFKWAVSSSLRWTIVPEVFDPSLQPLRKSCELMNRTRSEMHPSRERGLRMLSPPKRSLGGRNHPRGDGIDGVRGHSGDKCLRSIDEVCRK